VGKESLSRFADSNDADFFPSVHLQCWFGGGHVGVERAFDVRFLVNVSGQAGYA